MSAFFDSRRVGYVLLILNVVLAILYYDRMQWLSTFAATAAGMVFTKLWHMSGDDE